MLLCLQTAAEWTLCEHVRWAVVGERREEGVIRCVTYVPFILIPSKESGANKSGIRCNPFSFN